MKAVTVVAAALVFFSAASMQGQSKENKSYFSDPSVYKSANIPTALKAFESCLAMENAGVQESALAQLAMLKMVLPAVDAGAITRRLEEMSTSAPSPSTRFKAYIVSQVYSNPDLFANERGTRYNDGDELFNALAARLQSSLLSYSGH